MPTFIQPRNNYAVLAILRVPLSEYAWQVVPALRAARSNEAAAQYRKAAERLRVALSARLAYYSWLRTRAQIAVAEEALAGVQARLADARQGLAAGTLAEVDVLRLEALVGSAKLALTRAQSNHRIAERDLALQIGGEGPFVLGEDLFQQGIGQAPDLPQLLNRARAQRPDARALSKSADAARDAGLRAVSQYFPQLETVGTVNYANPNQLFFPPQQQWNLNWIVALNLRWNISRVMRGKAEVMRYEALERKLLAELEQLQRAITREVTTSWHQWKQAAAALAVTAKKLSAAEAAYDLVQKRYAAGLSTTTDLIDAEVTRNRAALEDVETRMPACSAAPAMRSWRATQEALGISLAAEGPADAARLAEPASRPRSSAQSQPFSCGAACSSSHRTFIPCCRRASSPQPTTVPCSFIALQHPRMPTSRGCSTGLPSVC